MYDQKVRDDINAGKGDIGYYDGEPLPHAGLVVIHLPSGTYPSLINRWETSDMFNPDLYTDISVSELEELHLYASGDYKEYYNKLLLGLSPTDDLVKDPYTTMLRSWSRKQASHYLDQIIKKYIPAGTQYILLDDNFNQIVLDL